MKNVERTLNIDVFKRLALNGLNCKQIAERMGWHSHSFGLKMKKVLGMYPSVYIARMKK